LLILNGNKMTDAKKDIEQIIDKDQLFQAQRLLERIEATHITCACRDGLCALVNRYFRMNHNNPAPKVIQLTITNFELDLAKVPLSCYKNDMLEIYELIDDIRSTFKLIIYKQGDYNTMWEKIKVKLNLSEMSFSFKSRK
jgi:hypothetical protein